MFVPLYSLLCILVVECYTKKLPLRIYNGIDTREDEYPYVVRLEVRIIKSKKEKTETIYHKHSCTASALSSTWVLTAGHCVRATFNRRSNTVIRYGSVKNSPYCKDTYSDVVLKIIHPLYSYSYQEYTKIMKNDIGLLKTTPMKVKSFGKLSAVDFISLYGYEAVVAGYGLMNSKLPNGDILTNSTLNLLKPLQILNVLIYKCSHSNLRPVLCLAPKCGRRTTACPGDSGGPLIHPSGVVGVVSLGDLTRDCLSPIRNRRTSVAGYILPISPYIEWIQSYVTA